jgi:hypothetical protein
MTGVMVAFKTKDDWLKLYRRFIGIPLNEPAPRLSHLEPRALLPGRLSALPQPSARRSVRPCEHTLDGPIASAQPPAKSRPERTRRVEAAVSQAVESQNPWLD